MMPEPDVHSGSGGGLSFLGSFGRSIFSSDTKPTTLDSKTDSGSADPPHSTRPTSGFRRVSTMNDVTRMSIPEEGTDGSAPGVDSNRKLSLATDFASKQQKNSEEGGGLTRRVSFGDFSKAFSTMVVSTTHVGGGQQTVGNPGTNPQPTDVTDGGSTQGRRHSSSVVWDWFHTSQPTSPTPTQSDGVSEAVRRHSTAPVTEHHLPASTVEGMGKKKFSFRDLNAYAPSNF